MTQTPSKLSSALALAARGFRVFPLASNTKIPLKGFTDFARNATTDPEKIKQWFTGQDHNIGISTENLLAVDIDVKDKKKNGLETIAEWNKLGKILPPTTGQITTSGGMHLIYNTPFPVSNSASKLGDGVDVRGNGGYLAADGSTIGGKVYRMDTQSLNTAPQWLLQACSAAREEKPKAHLKIVGVDTERAKRRAGEYLLKLPPVESGSRNQAAFAVAAMLKDFGLNQEDTFIMMMNEWKCEPPLELDELRAVVTSAYKYGKEAQGSAAPEAMFAVPDAAPEGRHPFQIMNDEYAFVSMGSSYRILHETTDEEGKFVTIHLAEDTFHKKLASRRFQIGDGNSKSLTKAWMESAMRRSYDGIVFAPEEKVDPRFYNLWRGFSVEPLKENEEPTQVMKDAVAKFEEHLCVNICDSNFDDYTWVYGWFAHIVQKPWEKPEVALVMRGRKGVGKNVLLDMVGNLFKLNYMVTAQKRHLLSNFNSHMEKLLLIVLNEAFWSGSKEEGGLLKALITDKEIEIERKGVDSYPMKSRLRTAIVGNENWIVPATEDERRYAVFNVGETRMQDTDFFTALVKGMEAGGYRYLLTKLLEFDLSQINVRKAPQTEGLAEQKENSLTPIQKWWLDSITQGYIEGVSFDGSYRWEVLVDKKILLDAFAGQLKDKKISLWLDSNNLMINQVKELAPGASIIRKEGFADRVSLPSLENCRDEWNKKMKTNNKWL